VAARPSPSARVRLACGPEGARTLAPASLPLRNKGVGSTPTLSMHAPSAPGPRASCGDNGPYLLRALLLVRGRTAHKKLIVEADLELFCNWLSAGFLGERLYL